MVLHLGFIIPPEDVWIVVAFVSAWLVLMCLKTIGIEIYNAVRWHNLKVEAHTLRLQQINRIRELRVHEVNPASSGRKNNLGRFGPPGEVDIVEEKATGAAKGKKAA